MAGVLHLDVDAFFASVEQILDPSLRGRPVVVGSGVIASASYEARRYGLATGMPLFQAWRRCPQLILKSGEYGHYSLFAAQIEGICRDHSPAVEQSSLDDFYMDWDAAAPRSAAKLRHTVAGETGLSVSLGWGRNKLFARLASRRAKPGGAQRIAPEQEAAVLSSLPIEELPGIGPCTARELSRYQIRSVPSLAACDPDLLAQLFGVPGRTMSLRSRGVDPRPIVDDIAAASLPSSLPATIRRETTLAEPTASLDFLRGMLAYLTQRASAALRRLGASAGRVTAMGRYTDYAEWSGSASIRGASHEDRVLVPAALAICERQYGRRLALRWVGIELGHIVPAAAPQGDLFDPAHSAASRRLRGVIDQVRTRYGFQAIVEGNAIPLLGRLPHDRRGFRLRTSSLSR